MYKNIAYFKDINISLSIIKFPYHIRNISISQQSPFSYSPSSPNPHILIFLHHRYSSFISSIMDNIKISIAKIFHQSPSNLHTWKQCIQSKCMLYREKRQFFPNLLPPFLRVFYSRATRKRRSLPSMVATPCIVKDGHDLVSNRKAI